MFFSGVIAIFNWLQRRFFTGLVVVAPIGLTIWLVWTFISFIDDRIKPLIPPSWNPETYIDFAVPGLGLLFVLAGFVVVGSITANLVGHSILSYGENMLRRVPLISNIYSALKQIFEAVAHRGLSSSMQDVVLIPYPRQGLWAIGFITAEVRGEVATKLPDMVGVFVPTTPNPTSGFLVYALPDDLIRLDMSVEEGAKLVVSGGLIVPEMEQQNTDSSGDAKLAPELAKKLQPGDDNT